MFFLTLLLHRQVPAVGFGVSGPRLFWDPTPPRTSLRGLTIWPGGLAENPSSGLKPRSSQKSRTQEEPQVLEQDPFPT